MIILDLNSEQSPLYDKFAKNHKKISLLSSFFYSFLDDCTGSGACSTTMVECTPCMEYVLDLGE